MGIKYDVIRTYLRDSRRKSNRKRRMEIDFRDECAIWANGLKNKRNKKQRRREKKHEFLGFEVN